MNRLSSLDYLRGLAAFGVMAFHYSMWNYGFAQSQDFIGRVGIYAVPIFYVLSGITLYHVYYNKPAVLGWPWLRDFFIKRAFRILPLLILLDLVHMLVQLQVPDARTVFLNFTGLFGLIEPGNTILYGGWSIGNELVFYLFFPVFVLLSRKWWPSMALFALGLYGVFIWFTFIDFAPPKTMFEIWNDYMNPLNHVAYFLSGYLIGLLGGIGKLPRKYGLPLIAVFFASFIFFPTQGDSMVLVCGTVRVVLSLVCVVLCYLFYKTELGLPRWLHRPFAFLGEVSYCLYLVHPLVWDCLRKFDKSWFGPLPVLAKIFLGYTLSLILSRLIYILFERYFMRMGKAVSAKLSGGAV